MNQDVQSLYQFLLQQHAAEVYVDNALRLNRDAMTRALVQLGNNREGMSQLGLTRLTQSQFDEFFARYEIIEQISDNPTGGGAESWRGILLNTGFSATLLFDRQTQKYTFAIRSVESKLTAEGGDQERDVSGAAFGIAFDGFAWAQIDTMERVYAELRSSGRIPAGERINVTGYSLGGHLSTIFTELHASEILQTVTFNGAGRGTWIPARGNLSDMLTFYRNVLANPDASSYIPPAFSEGRAEYLLAKSTTGPMDGINLHYDARYKWAQLATRLVYGTTGTLLMLSDPTRITGLNPLALPLITQVYGLGHPAEFFDSVVANSGVHGPARSVFIEDQPIFGGGLPPVPPLSSVEAWTQGEFGGGHSIVLIGDSLAVARVMNQLDPASTLDSAAQIFQRATWRVQSGSLIGGEATAEYEFDALENVLDGLRRTLQSSAVAFTPYATGGRGYGNAASRATFHTNLKSLTDSAGFQALSGKLTLTSLNTASVLASSAKADFGEFVALKTLSPFALKPKDGVEGAAETLNGVWIGVHRDAYIDWTADTAARLAGTETTFTDNWYADRSALLSAVLQRNQTNDVDGFLARPRDTSGIATEYTYFDSGTPITLITAASGMVPTNRLVQFADDAGRTLVGMNNPAGGRVVGDGLYGGNGNDLLQGLGGHDHLEGAGGADRLEGGSGHDTLLGGAGIDTLFGDDGDDLLIGGADADQRIEGGIGRDYLEGGASGAGFDNYHLSTSDTAVDTIFDSDNTGRLFVDGTMIGGFTCIQPNLYESTGGLYRMVVLGDGSTTSTATLYRKSDGRTLANIIGIQGPTVLGYTLPPPPSVGSPTWTFGTRPQDDTIHGTVVQGSTTLTPGFGQIRGWDGHDWIVGGTYSRMEIVGDTGNDVLYDQVLATNDAGQNTLLFGGAGSDFLYGTGASMTLSGGTGNDFISSARYNSAPVFTVLARGTNGELTELLDQAAPTVVTALGERLSLTGTEIAGALGSYDAGLQRWLFYYRPFSEGTAVGGATMREDNQAFNHFLSAYITNGVIDRLLPSFAAEPGASPVNGFQLSWTTNPAEPLAAANVTFLREDGVYAPGVVAHLLPNTTSFQIQAQDGNTSLPDRAYIDAGDNDDLVYGGAGRDIVQGGSGADRIDGAGGEDFIQGGAGDDFLVGGRFNDVIAGGDDHDILHGAGESDSLYGGSGNDVLMGDLYFTSYDSDGFATSYQELQPAGADILDGGSGNDTLDAGAGNDVLFGGDGHDLLSGGAGNDVMHGGAGDDVLVSERGSGIGNDDVLDGGAGNDTYVFLSNLSVICDNIGAVDGIGSTALQDSGGVDAIRTNFHRMTLPTEVENLTLDGYAVNGGTVTGLQYEAWGRDTRARYVGNDSNNIIDASRLGQRANFLQSFLQGVVIDGGAGADTMTGAGETSDTYIVDDVGDVVIETAAWFPGSTARDRIVTPFATTLAASLANLEEVELVGSASVQAVGNARDNMLIGSTNSAANFLSGLAGDDVYRVDLLDTVTESAGGGVDTLSIDGATLAAGSVVNVSLSSYANFENLEVFKGSTIANLTGNSVDNRLAGSAGGGTLDGGTGNDTIIDFDISPYWDRLYQQHFNVPLNGSHVLRGGAGNDSLTSGGGADVLDGGSGNDVLQAYNGLADVVFGGGYGQDTFSVLNSIGAGTLRWTEATDFSTLRSTRVGNNLQLSLSGGVDRLDLANYYAPLPSSSADFAQWKVGDQLYLSRSVIDAFVAVGAPGVSSASADFLATAAAGGTLNASTGDDVLLGSIGVDILNGEAGNDSIAGSAGNDTLSGGDGTDKLDGGSGNDQLTGGTGNDEVVAGAGNDIIHFSLGAGQDLIKNNLLETIDGVDVLRFNASIRPVDVTVSADNSDGLVVSVAGGDQITVTGSQRDFNDVATSQGFSWTAGDTRSTLDRIEFSDGTVWTHADLIARTNPRLGTPGNDTLIAPHGYAMRIEGLAGNDILTGRDGADQLIGGDGYDQLLGGDNNDLLDGGAGGGWLRGEAGDDTLIGGTGDDLLDGGSGADTMTGGAGNDVYVIDSAGDVVNEAVSGGTDEVRSPVDYVLGANLENLGLLGYEGLRGEGNSSANTIFGTVGNDTLIGGGGVDALRGTGGNDLYIGTGDGDTFFAYHHGGTDWNAQLTVDNVAPSSAALGTLQFEDPAILPIDLVVTRGIGTEADDVVIALRGTEGTVVVKNHFLVTASQRRNGISSLRFADGYTLDRNGIDALIGVPPANGADLTSPTLWGTSANDNLNGTAGDDRILGFEGSDFLNGWGGADTLAGGTGDDYYFVDDVNDYVYEAFGAGIDGINSTVTYALPTEVESLALTGTSNINATGNAGANSLYGNAGVNQISGGAGNDYIDGGAGADVLQGGDGNDTLIGGADIDTLAGGAGNDLYVVDVSGDVVTENVNEGSDTIQAAITYTLGANVETLTLSGTAAINGTGNSSDNTINGNTAANALNGGAGNDTLNGGMGADAMAGGTGNDTFVVDNTGDVTTELAGEGTDTVQSSLTWTLAANVENLTLIGAAVINGTGNTLVNTLTGNSAANRLDGGAGADTLIGGLGNDTYVIDNTADIVTEGSNAGTDLVEASATFTLGANIENITLTGAAAINATGNSSNNTLTGNAAANRLDGGAGNDTMVGGAGNDIYVVNTASDIVTEAASAGTDTVETGITYTLGANLENLTLTGTAAINATGNTVANVLTGNAGANTLNGAAGADTMAGAAGNDIYIVDNVGDVVTEAASAGTDRVDSSVTYTLSANVENLTLTGTAAINGTGNTLNNVLTGNTSANRLDGGAGSDTMTGGTGDDVYVVDATADVVTEAASAGIDRVESSVSYVLGVNVENLTLTGAAAINATGNTVVNTLTGNAAANRLDGGTGADTMIGGAGDDVYLVDNAADIVTEAASAGIDRVEASVTTTLAANVENLTLTGTAAINATGNTLGNVIIGNAGANVLNAGAGNDTLTDSGGANVFIGGAGNDTLNVTSTGIDRIAVARGHGIDTVIGTGTAANDVLEVSNGIAKSVMGLIKTGNDLIVDLGVGETVTLRNWYTGVRNVGTLKIIGDAGWVPGQTGTPTLVETLNMVSLVTAFDAWRAANPTLTRWPLDSFGGGSFAAISDTRFGVSDEDHINPLGRAATVSGSKFALLSKEPVRAVRTTAVDDGSSQLVTLAPPYSPNLASAESEIAIQPNLKSFMKFWTRQVPVAVPAADWYGVPSGTDSAITIATAEASARSTPWWESDSASALTSLIAGTVERRPAITMPFVWESVHSELLKQLTHAPESAMGEQMPHDVWATVGSASVLSEGVDLRRLMATEYPQRAAGRVIQALR